MEYILFHYIPTYELNTNTIPGGGGGGGGYNILRRICYSVIKINVLRMFFRPVSMHV